MLFKLFDKHRVNTLQAIVVNYIIASSCGILFYDQEVNLSDTVGETWFSAAVGLGILFISIFNVMALTAQKNGLSVASVASKMSVIIPILFGIIIYKESIAFQKLSGIILALVAVYLTSIKAKTDTTLSKSVYLPLILFLGSGVIDTSVNHFAPEGNMSLFLSIIFACAGIIGFLIVCYNRATNKIKLNSKSIPFGIALGIVNYGSMYFLLKALRVNGYETSSVFTINNVAIVTVSCILGLLLFKEVISKKNWIGITLAIISIVLVTL